ncbi:polysaccharide deacetylase family protein [Candidatus Sumerlaeota bacterium]|nr:polysaccharide deacetylase family protein [Candidatus Sumerlaeota bacterium]
MPHPTIHNLPPAAFIQIDLDGVWAVRRCYGLDEGEYLENDPVYEEGIPRFLEILDRKDIKATFFVVGRDALIPKKKEIIWKILKAGHEVGNHSFNHTLGLTRLSDSEIREDIAKTQEALIEAARSQGYPSGWRPVGFRAPGYDIDIRILRILKEMGFLYDASLFPTYWGFLMRLIDGYISGRFFSGKRQYGSFRNGFQSLAPHEIEGIKGLYEIPVSVSPYLRLPFHFGISCIKGFSYFRRIAERFKKKGIPLLYLFHGVDFVDTENIQLLPGKRGQKFFSISYQSRLKMVEGILDYIRENFTIIKTCDYLKPEFTPNVI